MEESETLFSLFESRINSENSLVVSSILINPAVQ